MPFNDTQDRVFPASPRRRREARRQGYVWHSSELAAALTTGGAALLLLWLGPAVVRDCAEVLLHALTANPVVRSDQLADSLNPSPLRSLAGTAAALLLGAWLLALLARFVQVGPLLAPALVRPDAGRISPTAGLRRLFAGETFARGGVWLLRLVVVAGVVAWTLRHEAASLARLVHAPPGVLAAMLGQLLSSFVLRLAGGLLLSAVLDALWQRSAYERRLRMTADEVRAERRESSRPQIDRRRTPSVAQSAEPLRGI